MDEIIKSTFIPQKIAQRCPVCNGFGTLKWGSKTCQACKGKGYILVPADTQEGQKDGGMSYGKS